MNFNAIRLCFQCHLNFPGRDPIPLMPKVSDVIRDKKAYNDLTIVDHSDNWSPVTGGKKILLFTKKVSKSDIQVHFSFEDPKTQKRMVLRGSFTPYNVHEQYAISLTTPPFIDQHIKKPVLTYMFLYKPSEGIQSEPVDFYYYPSRMEPTSSSTASSSTVDEGLCLTYNTSKKRRKSIDRDLISLADTGITLKNGSIERHPLDLKVKKKTTDFYNMPDLTMDVDDSGIGL